MPTLVVLLLLLSTLCLLSIRGAIFVLITLILQCARNANETLSQLLVRGRSQTTYTKRGRQVVLKCPLFVKVQTKENVNKVIKKSQDFDNVVCERPLRQFCVVQSSAKLCFNWQQPPTLPITSLHSAENPLFCHTLKFTFLIAILKGVQLKQECP